MLATFTFGSLNVKIAGPLVLFFVILKMVEVLI